MVRSPLLVALVDDDADVRLALEGLVASADFAVESFASGAAFLQSLASREPDCVVLDLQMPDMSGFEIASALARSHPALPVVAITGYDTSESRSRAKRLKVSDYLPKPVEGDALLAAINAAIGKQR